MLVIVACGDGDQVSLTHGIGHQGVAQAGRLLIGENKQAVVRNLVQQSLQCAAQIGGGYDTLLTHRSVTFMRQGGKGISFPYDFQICRAISPNPFVGVSRKVIKTDKPQAQ